MGKRYFESNARLRDELLEGSLKAAQIVIESWRRHYMESARTNRLAIHPSAGARRMTLPPPSRGRLNCRTGTQWA
jgi:hypothetical protein